MANVMSMRNIRNKTTRSGFDLSRRNCFTAKVGQLLPVMVEEVLPGDHFEINPNWFTRTAPVNTAAFTRVNEYYDFFFVPNRLMWRYFMPFVTQMPNDVASPSNSYFLSDPVSLSSSNFFGTAPYMTMQDVEAVLIRLNVDDDVLSPPVIPQKGGSKYTDIFGFSRYENAKRLLNMLGYGDFSHLDKFKHSVSSVPSIPSGDRRANSALSVFPLFAYQKIYQDFFRNDQWERANPFLWNCDYLADNTRSRMQINVGSLYDTIANNNYFNTWFDLKYASWNKDYFMGLLPSAQYGNVAAVNIDGVTTGNDNYQTGTDKNKWAFPNGHLPAANVNVMRDDSGLGLSFGVDSAGATDIRGAYHNHNININNAKVASQLSVIALRQAEMLQKWREISNSGKQNYADQIEKHFGVKVPHNLANMCDYLGGCQSTISINEVVNTNLADSSSTPDIAGKGVGSGKGNISFTAKEHGVLMCVYHATPILDWQSYGVRRQNTKIEATDYAIPEFDRIGMESVPLQDLYDRPVTKTKIENGMSLGYAPRYVEYKTAVDEIHGAFLESQRHWVAPITGSYLLKYLNSQTVSGGSQLLDYTFFKVNPAVMDPIFTFSAGHKTDSDVLFCACQMNCHAVRNLDYDGLPY